jgi:hypothetical protein
LWEDESLENCKNIVGEFILGQIQVLKVGKDIQIRLKLVFFDDLLLHMNYQGLKHFLNELTPFHSKSLSFSFDRH